MGLLSNLDTVLKKKYGFKVVLGQVLWVLTREMGGLRVTECIDYVEGIMNLLRRSDVLPFWHVKLGKQIFLHSTILCRARGILCVCIIFVTRCTLPFCITDILLIANTVCFFSCSYAGHGLHWQSRIHRSFETPP